MLPRTQRNPWDEFVRSYWEKEALVSDDFKLTLSNEELFEIATRIVESPLRVSRWMFFSSLLRRIFSLPPIPLSGRPSLQFYVFSYPRTPLGRILEKFFIKWMGPFVSRRRLPHRSDGSFEGYHQRIDSMLNPWWRRLLGLPKKRYCLVLNNLNTVSFELYKFGTKFMCSLYRRVGAPNGGFYNQFFLGNYASTPSGIHHDYESLFTYVLVGEKRMQFWEPDYIREHPEAVLSYDVEKHRAHAKTLTAQAGQLIYWPSKYWHVGEGNGEFVATLGMGVVLQPLVSVDNPVSEEEPCEALSSQMRVFAQHNVDVSESTVPINCDDLDANVIAVPATLRFSAPPGESDDLIWLRYVSSLGALYPPIKRKPTVIRDDAMLAPQEGSVVVALPHSGSTLAVGVNGHILSVPVEEGIQLLLAFAKFGERETVHDLVARCSARRSSEQQVRHVLEALIQCRAIQYHN